MFEIKRGEGKGSWNRGSDAMPVTICCPVCGKIGSLADHEIADDGVVSPSVVCPRSGCSFHQFVRLLDYKS